jgi:hypothetical protein
MRLHIAILSRADNGRRIRHFGPIALEALLLGFAAGHALPKNSSSELTNASVDRTVARVDYRLY